MASEPGPVVAAFPRTVSMRNWPFLAGIGLVFLAFDVIIGVEGRNGYAVLIPSAIVGGVIGVVLFLFWGIPRLVERMGFSARLDGVHENGLLASFKGSQLFWPWTSLTLTEDQTVSGPHPWRRQVIVARPQEHKIVLLSSLHGSVAMNCVASHLSPDR